MKKYSQLYECLCYTSQDKKEIRKENNIVFEDSRETKSLFQMVKM